MVTSDTDSYIPLIINGTRDAAAIKEMIFTKVQLSFDSNFQERRVTFFHVLP